MKDNFSAHAADYAHYRPQYPQELYDFILGHVPGRERAWDCGAGNGQMSAELAKYFGAVYATDISAEQLAQAPTLPNATYSVQPAEQTDFPDKQFDLITVAQAIHWFDFDRFYAEVRRVAVPGALLCAAGYSIIRIDAKTDALIDHFYHRITRRYWDDERRHIDAAYASIPFPFREIAAPRFESRYRWTLEQLIGYLNTWSGVKHFIMANGYNPVNDLEAHLRSVWNDGVEKEVVFPVFLRAGTT